MAVDMKALEYLGISVDTQTNTTSEFFFKFFKFIQINRLGSLL